MREILFRGKANSDGRDNEWVYGSLLSESENTFPIIVRDYENDEDCIGVNGWDTVYPETVGQYTGLNDKNGEKVFEGDIVRWDGDEISIIRYCEGVYRLCNAKGYYGVSLHNHFSYVEVIGNIHDNPELLKGGEK